jgi:hypothetical protein
LVLNESDLDWPGLELELPKREARDSVLEREGEVRCSITVDERDRKERREKHFYFWEEHLVGRFPCLTLSSPPDKISVNMETLQL